MADKKDGNKNKDVSTDVVIAELEKLENAFNNLKKQYDQFFTGFIKVEPQPENKKFQKLLRWFSPEKLKTTGAKFKFSNIQTRYIQMSNLWHRHLREMEEGTFKRDKFHAKLHSKEPAQAPTQDSALSKNEGNTKKQLEMLYEKLQQLSGPGQALPNKESFTKAVHAQIKKHKQDHPDQTFELRLQKEKSGKFQLMIKGKKK